MALYRFKTSVYLGWSHSGGVSTSGVSDKDVDILVGRIKEFGSHDYKELKLSRTHPNLYNKLRRTYRKLAYETEELYWLINGLEEGYYEYDDMELMKYCAKNCGFDLFEYDEYDDDSSEDEEYDDEEQYLLVLEQFRPWLRGYVETLNYKEAIHFFHDIMEVDMDFDESYFSNSYSTILPQKIIDIAS